MRIKKYTEELSLMDDMEALVSAYEEISVMKMRQIRQSVLSTRDFMQEVSEVFYKVKASYRQQIETLLSTKKRSHANVTFSTVPNNGKTVVVLLSANAKLYGNVISKTFFAFLDAVQREKCDIVIIGSLGKELYNEYNIKNKYTFFEIPDTKVTFEDIKTLITYLSQYQTVKVFYGKFVNVVTQLPESSIISGQQVLEEEMKKDKNSKEETYKYFYEPSLETILHFFESQIFSSLFQELTHEHELARYASRINAMEEAYGNINKRKSSLGRQEKIAQKSLTNSKQLYALAGMRMWKA